MVGHDTVRDDETRTTPPPEVELWAQHPLCVTRAISSSGIPFPLSAISTTTLLPAVGVQTLLDH